LTDSSGINITGFNPEQSVIMEIHEGTRLIHERDLTDRVTFGADSFTGELEFYLPDSLSLETRYRLTLSASDNFNLRSSASLDFLLVEGKVSDFSLAQVFNVPNPMDEVTTFLVEMTEVAEVVVTIFTSSGKRIRELRPGLVTPVEARQRGITWDGRDEDGDRPANGVYFYKVTARTPNGERQSRIERLAVLR
jgi:hypothetical protein